MIVARLQGGMGNQMFQYAAGRALAHRHGVPLTLDTSSFDILDPDVVPRTYDLGVFRVRPDFVSNDPALQKQYAPYHWRAYRGLAKHLPAIFPVRYLKEYHSTFDTRYTSAGADLYLDGYWQSERYFSDIVETIRTEFTVTTTEPATAAAMRTRIAAAAHPVALNVRRADFVNHAKMSAFHGTCDVDYYDRAVAMVRERVSNPTFFVFSDDVPWCMEHIVPRYDAAMVTHECAGTRFEHYLTLFASCEHQIIPNSSFGWWAAWMNQNPDKVVVAPHRWTQTNLDTTDMIPASWLRA